MLSIRAQSTLPTSSSFQNLHFSSNSWTQSILLNRNSPVSLFLSLCLTLCVGVCVCVCVCLSLSLSLSVSSICLQATPLSRENVFSLHHQKSSWTSLPGKAL
jgi:hypothetical protein